MLKEQITNQKTEPKRMERSFKMTIFELKQLINDINMKDDTKISINGKDKFSLEVEHKSCDYDPLSILNGPAIVETILHFKNEEK
jgi:hypothetical protein